MHICGDVYACVDLDVVAAYVVLYVRAHVYVYMYMCARANVCAYKFACLNVCV